MLTNYTTYDKAIDAISERFLNEFGGCSECEIGEGEHADGCVIEAMIDAIWELKG
jgi:hypothetical protein